MCGHSFDEGGGGTLRPLLFQGFVGGPFLQGSALVTETQAQSRDPARARDGI
jgi:hypothetical protein